MRHILIGCSASKRDGAHDRERPWFAACELYTGALFVASLRWARERGGRIWILSAMHGLVDERAELQPYDHTLRTVAERQAWARRVERSLLEHTARGDELVALAGERYLGWIPELVLRGRVVSEPLAGKQIGQRKQWFARERDRLAADPMRIATSTRAP